MARLNITPERLSSVGNSFSKIADGVNDCFRQMQNITAQVTSNSSWSGEASSTFINSWNNVEPELRVDCTQLTDLGPTLVEIARQYSMAEDENKAKVGGGF